LPYFAHANARGDFIMLFALQVLLAQAAENGAGQQQAPPAGNFLVTIAPFLAIGLLAWFFLIRPMKRQEHERQALLNSLKKNDRVVTSGGIIGIVANIKDDEVTLKVDESSNVRLRVTRSSVVKILGGEEPAKEQQKNGGA
jgi:preprotein translocase subunit YajC